MTVMKHVQIYLTNKLYMFIISYILLVLMLLIYNVDSLFMN